MQDIRQSQQKVMDRTENVFGDDEIETMFAEFTKVAKDGKLGRDAFPGVLSKLFEDPDDEQVAVILTNELLMDRMFSFLDTDKSGMLTHEQLADGIGTMFSAETKDHVTFKFFVYDEGQKGFFTPDDMLKVCKAHLAADLALRAKERTGDAKAAFDKGVALVQGETGDAKLRELIGYAFQAADANEEGKISKEQFAASYPPNQELFDWNNVVEDVLDELEAELEGALD